MAITIKHAPISKTYTLIIGDDSAEITVFQADSGANRRRSELFSQQERIFDEDSDSVIIRSSYNVQKIRRMEAYQTLGSCELVLENGTQYFKTKDTGYGPRVRDAMTESEFNALWDALPSSITDQISEFVRDTNSSWGN